MILQWLVLPLADNYHEDVHKYELHINTGFAAGLEQVQTCSSDLMELKVKQDRERWLMESERYIAAKDLDCLNVTRLVFFLNINARTALYTEWIAMLFRYLSFFLQISTALDVRIQYY